MNEIRFDERVVVVTGAGGGLGRAHALELARRGAAVVVNDLGGAVGGTGADASMADAVVREIEEAGGRAVANHDSVATPEGGEAVVKTALDRFGRVDAVVNNAGILRDKSFAKLEPQDLEAVLAVHLKGAFFVSQPAFRAMREQRYGRFVFTSSGSGLFGNFGQSNYAAAKMGMVGLSNTLALEGEKYGIRSNVIAPAAYTRMTEEILGELAEALDPASVSPLVSFLASEQCELSHEIFSVGGGRFARVFVGLAPGWYAGRGAHPSAEDVRDHMPEIRQLEGYGVPGALADELALVAKTLKG
jgi:NAD(P)-dependent dehydrogenase (short-subunit alcohol dehydrogenase family)